MSYKVLYRKYRPQTFSDIIDQNFITDTLKESIINNRISHAYIFSGPKGTGKTSTAKVFAKTINCESPVDGEPCGKCNACLNFNTNPDIIELDAASNNKVEDIREIVNNVKLAPTYSKYKIYIIDEVHMLTNSASNAFLLTLEEPPAHAIFILATTNPESLPQTILSRCQHFAFSKISKKALISRLKYVLDKENIKIDDNVIAEIANISDGGLRDALSILDQLITLNKPITIDLLTEQFGVISEESIKKLLDAIINNDTNEIIILFNSYKDYGISERSFIYKLVSIITEYACKYKLENKDDIVIKLKTLLDEILKLDTSKTVFNYYDVIETKILSVLDANSDSECISQKTEKHESKEIPTKTVEETKIINESVMTENTKNIEEERINNLLKVNLIDVRINNSFVGANKKIKSEFEANYSSYTDKFKNQNDIYSLILDTRVGVVSPTNVLIVCDSDASANLLNEKSNQMIKINSFDGKLPVFVSVNKWNQIKDDYQKNKDKGIKYTYTEEPKEEDSDALISMADNIFGNENLIVEE